MIIKLSDWSLMSFFNEGAENVAPTPLSVGLFRNHRLSSPRSASNFIELQFGSASWQRILNLGATKCQQAFGRVKYSQVRNKHGQLSRLPTFAFGKEFLRNTSEAVDCCTSLDTLVQKYRAGATLATLEDFTDQHPQREILPIFPKHLK